MLGVAAADITLDGLSEYLAERKISPGTLSYILDHQGRVIANSDLAQDLHQRQRPGGAAATSRALDNELPAIAFSARPREQRASCTRSPMAARTTSPA